MLQGEVVRPQRVIQHVCQRGQRTKERDMKGGIRPPGQVSQPSHHFCTVTLLYEREQVGHRAEEWRQFASMEKYHAVKIVIANEARCESRRREETGQKP